MVLLENRNQSIDCVKIVYSFSVFKYIISKDIQKNDVISVLSSLFLPCYAIHMFVIAAVKNSI